MPEQHPTGLSVATLRLPHSNDLVHQPLNSRNEAGLKSQFLAYLERVAHHQMAKRNVRKHVRHQAVPRVRRCPRSTGGAKSPQFAAESYEFIVLASRAAQMKAAKLRIPAIQEASECP